RRGITEQQLIKETWLGDESRAPYLLERLREFTDSPDLTKPEKLREQIQRAHDSDSPVYAYGRFAEKLATFKRDLWSIRHGLMTFASQADADHYLHNKL